MNMDISRTTEALLAGAGSHTPQSSEADFRIDRWRSDQWKIIVLSPAPANGFTVSFAALWGNAWVMTCSSTS